MSNPLVPIVQGKRYEQQYDVVTRYAANLSPTQIARELKIPRKQVMEHIEEWRSSAIGMEVLRDRMEELLATMDNHYTQLIRKGHEVINYVDEQAEGGHMTMTAAQMLGQKTAAIKLIATLEKDRIDMLQKTGMLEINNLGDEIAQLEEQKKVIIEILTDELCKMCKPAVMARLQMAMSGNSTVAK